MSDVREPLPYASSIPLAIQGELFRAGPLLVARNHALLPPRCVLCGEAPAGDPLTLQFTWDPTFRVTRMMTLQVRQEGDVRAFLCGPHLARYHRRRRIGIAGMVLAGLIMLAGIVVAITSELSDVPRYTPQGIGILFAGFAVMIAFLFIFTLGTQTLRCTKLEQDYLYLEGASENLLTLLPPLAPVSGM